MTNTPQEERDIAEAIAAVESSGGTTLYASAITMGQLYVELKEMGVDTEYILDLIRIVFMFAGPSDPQFSAAAVADTGKGPRN